MARHPRGTDLGALRFVRGSSHRAARQSVIRAFADRLAALGKKPKVILTACVRKLLVIVNTMLKNKALWNPEISIT
jgi:transposase